jgi:arylsulfatase
MNQWKGIKQKMNQGKNQLELYDLSTDPKETTDVAAKNPEIVAKIQEIMKGQHMPSKEFPLPLVDFDPKKNPMNKKKS